VRPKSALILAAATVLAWAALLYLEWVCSHHSYDIDATPPYGLLNRLRILAWVVAALLSPICAIAFALTAQPPATASSIPPNPSRRFHPILIATSIVLQQAVFVATPGFEYSLINVSAWVVSAPIYLLWTLYFLIPFFYVRPLSVVGIFRSYATKGWLVVLAAIAWNFTYASLCQRDGIPVSYDAMRRDYEYRGIETPHERPPKRLAASTPDIGWYPNIQCRDWTAPDVPRLNETEKFPAIFRDASRAVAAALQREGLIPSEYYVEVNHTEYGSHLKFDLWHESVVGSHYSPKVTGDPSGKCRTVIYDPVAGAVTKIHGWR